jgi:hypothetical protein
MDGKNQNGILDSILFHSIVAVHGGGWGQQKNGILILITRDGYYLCLVVIGLSAQVIVNS